MDETRHIRGLFDRHHLVLFRVLRRLTGDADLAEDLVQETFVRALQAAGNYEERGAERAWLLTIARRLLADRRRAAARTPRLDPLADDDGSGLDLPLRRHPDLRLALERALAGLGSEEREAFVRHSTMAAGRPMSRHRMRARSTRRSRRPERRPGRFQNPRAWFTSNAVWTGRVEPVPSGER